MDEKLIGIVEARGVGKTTILFQKLLELKSLGKKALYISLHYPFLSSVNLNELANDLNDFKNYLNLDIINFILVKNSHF